MRHSMKRISPLVAIVVAGCLAAGCGGSITSSIGSLPSRTATVSARPTVTAAPTTQPPTHSVITSAPTAPSSASATSSASSGTSLLWLWILLGVLVLAGVIAWIARSAHRRSAAKAGRRSGLTDAYARGAALHDAMSVAEAPGGLAAADAAARWPTSSGAPMIWPRRSMPCARGFRRTPPTGPGSMTRSPRCRVSARRWTPSGPRAALAWSRPTSAAAWPPSSRPSARSGPLTRDTRQDPADIELSDPA
jgi:hypothetical protein